MALRTEEFGIIDYWPEFEETIEKPPLDHMFDQKISASFVQEGKYTEPTIGQIWPRIG